jgi:GMP synthase (glutamine-hydrolysing)
MALAGESGKGKRILVVKTGEPVPKIAEKRGQFADLIAGSIGPSFLGDYATVDVRTDAPPSPRAADAIVITGSSANVPTREAWMLRAEAWLREVVAVGTPVFGICFGHQILAQALGGEVQKNPRGREIGTMAIEQTASDPIFDGVSARFSANVTHIDSVVRLPPGAVALARSPLEDYHAIRFTPSCYGVQFHPEIDAEVMRGYVETRREILASEGFDVEAMLAAIGDGDAGRRTLQNFVSTFL